MPKGSRARNTEAAGAAAALRHFDDGEREHAAQSGGGLFPPLFVGVDDYFGIGAGEENVALGFEFLAQFAEIVNFSVEDDGERAGFVPDGLRAAGKIDDAEAPRANDNGRGGEKTFFIGTAMNDRIEHAADYGLAILLRVQSDNTTNSAHGSNSPFGPGFNNSKCFRSTKTSTQTGLRAESISRSNQESNDLSSSRVEQCSCEIINSIFPHVRAYCRVPKSRPRRSASPPRNSCSRILRAIGIPASCFGWEASKVLE